MQTPRAFAYVTTPPARRLLLAFDHSSREFRAYEPGKLAAVKNSFGRPSSLGELAAGYRSTSTRVETPAVFYSDRRPVEPGASDKRVPSVAHDAGGARLQSFDYLGLIAVALVAAAVAVVFA